MSLNDSPPGRSISFAIRNLFRTSSPSSASPSRGRVSLLISRGKNVFWNNRNSFNHPSRSSAIGMNPASHFNPAIMNGLSDASQRAGYDNLDIFEWYPHYQNCQRYFLDHAQHSDSVQALCAFLNIRLPFQQVPHPVSTSSSESSTPSAEQTPSSSSSSSLSPPPVSLIPYIRRLVATGMDSPGVLHGFFGDGWSAGVGTIHEQERRNYLFAAKSGGWAAVKNDYDMPPFETIPFLRPLQGPLDSEIEAAERSWSEWLAMEDWMLGPRAPEGFRDSSSHVSRPRSSRG